MIFSLKTKLNGSGKFRRNWNVQLVFLETSWWAGFNGIYLIRFGFKMWEILILKWFLLLKSPMTTIIKTGLYRPRIGFFFITKTITPWSSTMTITNGRPIDNYALEWLFLTIMCQNDESLNNFWFFVIFLQQFESYEDRFHVGVIVCLAIFSECLFCLSFFSHFWKFYEVFCFVVRLHWSNMNVHSSSVTRTISFILSFSLPFYWWLFEIVWFL
jgi:hypothetical protein